VSDYQTYKKLCRFMESRKFVTEAVAATFVNSFMDVLFEMVTVDGELKLFEMLTFNIQDKVTYVKVSDDTLEIVRSATHTVDLDVTAARTLFSEAVRAYDFVIAEATAMALQSVNAVTGRKEPLGFDELSRENVLDSLPLPADLAKQSILDETVIRRSAPQMLHPVGHDFTQAKPAEISATIAPRRDPIYVAGVNAVHKRFHELQAKLALTKPEILSFMQCATEGILGLLSKYS